MLVGIDLGTTHSLIGAWRPDGPMLFTNASEEVLTPSVVSVLDDGDIVVGRAAHARLITHPGQTAAAFKRYMGTARETILGNKRFRPEELSALILRSLLEDATAHCGERPTEAVISVPAYFSDAQRNATRAAGELAGVRVERLINEPTAAALAYGLQHHDDEVKFLVFDLGGGTFDVSILEKFEGVMEVNATAGDNFLGGEDFADLLVRTALADLGVTDGQLSTIERSQLRARIERAKHQLSRDDAVDVNLTLAGKSYDWRIDESRFEHLSAPLMQRMRAPLERAMRDSKTSTSSLHEIVLVGGATRMPMVPRMLARMFGRLPLRHINPDEIVARGAAVMAGMKSRHESLREIVMTDVCPYTLGVETVRIDANGNAHNGNFSPIIERNTVIPASRMERFFAVRHEQTEVDLSVFQGESPRTVNNIKLGQLKVKLPRGAPHEHPVDVRFTYDVNGILEVEATVTSTGQRSRLVIEQNPGVMSAEEIGKRLVALADIKIHPRDRQANLAIIARLEHRYEESIGDARLEVGTQLNAFQSDLETQDVSRIERARRVALRFLAMHGEPLPDDHCP